MIILEGPDGGGKSTLAARLHRDYDYAIVKTGPPALDEDTTAAYLSALYTALARPGLTIFDRLHLGEAIYGPLLRSTDRMGASGLKVIERAIAENGVRLLICCPPWETLKIGWRSKPDLLKTEAQLRHVYEAYVGHAVRLCLVCYDWTAPDAEARVKEIIEA